MANLSLQAYRTALRATRIAFNGDAQMLRASRAQFKQSFLANQHLEDREELKKALTHLNEVSQFLVKNIVQGEMQENKRYNLKFHKQTELGSNETIKEDHKSKMGTLAGAKVRKCSDN